jgi:hypothetical protein
VQARWDGGDGAIEAVATDGRIVPAQLGHDGLAVFVVAIGAYETQRWSLRRAATAPGATVTVEPVAGVQFDQVPYLEVRAPWMTAVVRRDNGVIISLQRADRGRELVAYGRARWASYVDSARPDLALNVLQVTDEEWVKLRANLRSEAQAWMDGAGREHDVGEIALAGMIGSVAHLAYHLGAIRQLAPATAGPPERG